MGACRDRVIADKITGAGGECRAFNHQVAPVLRDIEIPATRPLCGSATFAFATSSVEKELRLQETGRERKNVTIRLAMTLVLLP